MSTPISIVATVVVFVTVCCVVDIRTRRIPNVLSGGVAVAGLVLNVLFSGWGGLVHGLAGAGAGAAVLFGPFALGGIGGGDVKMTAAIGALLGPTLVLGMLVIGTVAGGVITMAQLALLGRLREKLASTGGMMAAAASTRSLAPLKMPASDPGAVSLPYSVPLGIGTMAVLALAGAFGGLP